MTNRFHLARAQIARAFANNPRSIFTRNSILQLWAELEVRELTPDQFLTYLLAKTELCRIRLGNPGPPFLERYTWGKLSPHELALALRPNSYLCHGTAAFLHGLIREPTAIYSNQEQSAKVVQSRPYGQQDIDRVFAGKQRQSQQIFSFQRRRIILISGKHTGQLEVGTLHAPTGERLRATRLERTLIDIAVRPLYAGGVDTVLKAFRAAKEGASAETLFETLRKLNYMYPYHQVIGYYMQKAEYEPNEYERFRTLGMNFDFYLAHGIEDPVYDPAWRLFHPRKL